MQSLLLLLSLLSNFYQREGGSESLNQDSWMYQDPSADDTKLAKETSK